MSEKKQPAVRLVAGKEDDWPDPIRTYLLDPDRLRTQLTRLPAGQPLVLSHSPGERLNLETYRQLFDEASAEGRDVILLLHSE
jgi:hypothetical protein